MKRRLLVPTRRDEQVVDAEMVGDELAVHRAVIDIPGTWTCTHVRTGRQCHWIYFGSQEEARDFAEKIIASGCELRFDQAEDLPEATRRAMVEAYWKDDGGPHFEREPVECEECGKQGAVAFRHLGYIHEFRRWAGFDLGDRKGIRTSDGCEVLCEACLAARGKRIEMRYE